VGKEEWTAGYETSASTKKYGLKILPARAERNNRMVVRLHNCVRRRSVSGTARPAQDFTLIPSQTGAVWPGHIHTSLVFPRRATAEVGKYALATIQNFRDTNQQFQGIRRLASKSLA
jgi:hypothetical protein